jgi:hypothetical protein
MLVDAPTMSGADMSDLARRVAGSLGVDAVHVPPPA